MKYTAKNSISVDEMFRNSNNKLYQNILSSTIEWLIVDRFWSRKGDEYMIRRLIEYFESEEEYEKCRVLKVFLECCIKSTENDSN